MNISTEDRLIRTLRMCATYYPIWPLNSKDGKYKRLFCDCLWWFYTVNMINQCILLIKSTLHQEGFVNVLKSLVEISFICEIVFNFIYCRIRRERLQKLLFDIEEPEKVWTLHEQFVRRKFMRRLHKICIPVWIFMSVDLMLYIFSPLITNRMYPLNIVYPFPVSNFWVYCLTYIHSTISTLETFVVGFLEFMVTVIMWNAAFKFYLLGMQMRFVNTAEKLRASIVKYENIISYVREINSIFKIVILKTAIVTFFDIITSNLLVLNDVPDVELFEFFVVTFITIGRLFMFCWAAEEITEKAHDVAWQIYNSPCTYASPKLRQNVCIFIQRCQKPVVISATSFIPVVSTRFCGKLLYSTFSFFMAVNSVTSE